MAIRPIQELRANRFLHEMQPKQRRHLAMYDAYLAFKNPNQPIYDVVYRQKDKKGHTIIADFQERITLLQKIKQRIGTLLLNKKYQPIRLEEYRSTSQDIGKCLEFLNKIKNKQI